jgi:hypothetical protein
MLPHGIVEHLYKIKYCGTRLSSSRLSLMQGLVVLPCGEEAFSDGII